MALINRVPEKHFSGHRNLRESTLQNPRSLWAILNELIDGVNSGSPGLAGNTLTIEMSYTSADTGGKSSTTAIPDGSRVTMVRNIVSSIFDNMPTLTVVVDGTSDETILAAGDSNLTEVNEYHVEDTHDIVAATAGVVKLTVGGTPSIGAGKIIVEYTLPLA